MSDVIRKLTVGTPDFGLSYQINQTFNKGKGTEIKVTKILLDMEYLIKFGVDKYDVYAVAGGEGEKPWKSFSRQKTIVEYEF